jgi:UDP-N-acetylmuramate dehydrogenase
MKESNPELKKVIPGIQKNISLAKHAAFKIGGPAKYFYIAKTKDELVKAIIAAKKNNLPFFILGGGSNLLVSDKGYNGLVINFQFSIFNFQKNKIFAGAGIKLINLVKTSAEKGLSGLEWATGIPGTIGGAIYGNAGAFGKSMKDIIESVEVFDVKTEKTKTLKKKDCKFNYKSSVFKKNKNLIILSAVIKLKKPAVQAQENRKEIKNKIQGFLNYRKENHPLNLPSVGSIFKNPKKFPAGYLIEKCGLKGKKIGGAQVSEKHANFILNTDGAKAKDIIKLINLIKKKVKKKFGIVLEEEIQFLGF